MVELSAPAVYLPFNRSQFPPLTAGKRAACARFPGSDKSLSSQRGPPHTKIQRLCFRHVGIQVSISSSLLPRWSSAYKGEIPSPPPLSSYRDPVSERHFSDTIRWPVISLDFFSSSSCRFHLLVLGSSISSNCHRTVRIWSVVATMIRSGRNGRFWSPDLQVTGITDIRCFSSPLFPFLSLGWRSDLLWVLTNFPIRVCLDFYWWLSRFWNILLGWTVTPLFDWFDS